MGNHGNIPSNNIMPLKKNMFNKKFMPDSMKGNNIDERASSVEPNRHSVNLAPSNNNIASKRDNTNNNAGNRKSANRKSYNPGNKGDEKKKKQKYNTSKQQENKVILYIKCRKPRTCISRSLIRQRLLLRLTSS
jgi:hypothetical protein